MKTRLRYISLLLAMALLSVGWWKMPEDKQAISPNVLYSWVTEDDTRVDMAIQDNEMILYVGDHAQQTPRFQLIVKGGRVRTFHSVKAIEDSDGLNGVNVVTDRGKLNLFTITKTLLGEELYIKDEDNDLLPDTRKVPGKPREKIIWSYENEPKTTGRDP